MERQQLLDKIQEIQDQNYKKFKGTNECELMTREDIADLFFTEPSQFKPNEWQQLYIKKEEVCPECNGKGDHSTSQNEYIECLTCRGAKTIDIYTQVSTPKNEPEKELKDISDNDNVAIQKIIGLKSDRPTKHLTEMMNACSFEPAIKIYQYLQSKNYKLPKYY